VGLTTGTTYTTTGAGSGSGMITIPGAFVLNKPLLNLIPPTPIVPVNVAISVNGAGTATSAATQPSSLVSWWKAEGDASDALGINPGTLVGAVTFVPGRVGTAFQFTDAGTSYVTVPRSPTLEPANVTAIAWVRRPSATPPAAVDEYLLAKGAKSCIAASYALYSHSGGLQFYVFDGGVGSATSPDAGAGVWDGRWHQAAGTYDGLVARLYVDGVQIGAGTPGVVSIGYGLPDTNNFFVGSYVGACAEPFGGEVDEVMIFARALSLAEIQSIYASTPAH
jgi:hypothetical protein